MSLASESSRRTESAVEFVTAAARRAKFPGFVLAFALAYFFAARIGIATSLPPEGIVILWPPNAIVLAALLSVDRSRWPILFVATVATEVYADVPDYPLWAAIGYGMVNFSEAAIAASLLRLYRGERPTLARLRHFIAFLLIGPVLASGTAALFGAAIYKLGAPELDYLHYWRVFWFGDALGLLILGTTFLAWKTSASRLRALDRRMAAEAVALGVALAVVAGWAFLTDSEAPRVYLVFPILLWAAVRFGIAGASIAILTTVVAAIASAIHDLGPFAHLTHIDEVVALQGLIAVVALSTFMMAFASEDSRRATDNLHREVESKRAAEESLRHAYRELERVNAELDGRVAQRTEELEQAVARNELLLKELFHRVKNSLQIVSSLLALYSRGISDPAARDKLSGVQGQIGAIAAVYDVIHQVGSADGVDFCKMVPALCTRMATAAGPLVRISTTTKGESPVSADAAIALSLALNELITNSAKHALSRGEVSISVTCRREGDRMVLRVADDGPGFPPGFKLGHASGFGTHMTLSVVAQVNGQIRIVPTGKGATVEICVPVSDEAG